MFTRAWPYLFVKDTFYKWLKFINRNNILFLTCGKNYDSVIPLTTCTTLTSGILPKIFTKPPKTHPIFKIGPIFLPSFSGIGT